MFDVFLACERKVLRRAVCVACEAVAERGFRLLGGTLRDVSPEGAFLETDVEVDVGEEVFLAFRAPRTCFWIDAVARVVRRVPGRRTSDRGRGVGLRFEQIDALDRAVLRAALERLPPPVPARPLRKDYAATVLAVSG